MKDIDFDELDRAVNSIISGEPKKEPAEPSPAVTPPTVQQSAPPTTETDVPAAAKPSISGISGSVSRPSSPAARRSGRFMDVVHPSSDMKTAPADAAPARPSTRPVIKPLSADATTPASDEPADTSLSTTEVIEETAVVADETKPINDKAPHTEQWPDPIDLAEQQAKLDADARAGKADDDTSAETPAPSDSGAVSDAKKDEEAATTDATGAQTPFLADAKVEKRPLGGATPDKTAEPAPGSAADVLPVEPSALDLPPEYQPELVAIEAKEHSAEFTKEEPENQEPHEDKPEGKDSDGAQDKPTVPEPAKKPSPKLAPAPEKHTLPSAALATGSIPSQYRSNEKVADDDLHAIFDTHSYHQPLLPSKTRRKKSALAWILLIIGLVIVGAGLGVLLFMVGY